MNSTELTISEQKSALQIGTFNYEQKLALLTPEERAQCKELTKHINKSDITSVQVYGSELNSVIASNGDQLLASVRADNTNEVVDLTNELLHQLNMIDINDLENTGFKRLMRRIPILRRFVKSIENLFTEYDTVKNNVDKIAKKINDAKLVAQRDNSVLEQIFENDVLYIQQLRELIVAAKLKYQEMNDEIEAMKADATVEPYQINDANNFLLALEKRIADMETEEYVLTQNLFQIRATQHNNLAIADKSDNIVNNIIPIWKNQLALSVIMNNQKASVEAEQKIADTTNEMLRKNSMLLKTNSIEVARTSEKAVVDIDTLKDVTSNLIETLQEVKKIHDEGSIKRKEIEQSLQGFAKQLNESISNM